MIVMEQEISTLSPSVTKKSAAGGWEDMSEPEVKIEPDAGQSALPPDTSGVQDSLAAQADLPEPDSAPDPPAAPTPDLQAAQAEMEKPGQAAEAGNEAQGSAAFVTLSNAESDNIFQEVYDENTVQQPPPLQNLPESAPDEGTPEPLLQAPAQPEAAGADATIVVDTAAHHTGADRAVMPAEPLADDISPPALDKRSQTTPEPKAGVINRGLRRLRTLVRVLTNAWQKQGTRLPGLRWSTLGRIVKLCLIGLGSIIAGAAVSALIAVFLSGADKWQAEYLARLSDEKLLSYMAKLAENSASNDYPMKRQELDKELRRRVSAYAEAYWERILPQYQQCNRIAEQSLQKAWRLMGQKHCEVLDTMALLVEEEIRFYGSPDTARSGSLLIGNGIVLEGDTHSLRKIAQEYWKDLKLDQIAAVPEQDWLCLRCKVLKDRESIPILQGLSGSPYQQQEDALRKKIGGHKGLRVTALR